jgi:hypothetical protein
LLASLFFACGRFLHIVAAIVIAAPPAIDVGVRLVAKAPLTVVATALFVVSTLVVSRPLFFRRRCLTIIALTALSTLAHRHAVAFLLIVAFYASTLAATVATIVIVAIAIVTLVIVVALRDRRGGRSCSSLPCLPL